MEDETKRSTEEILSRYKILMHAKESGNIAETCREYGLSRKSFYKWKNRYIENGLNGLINKHSLKEKRSTFEKEENNVLNLSLESPSHGPSKISVQCSANGMLISPSSIQKILNKNSLGTIRDRVKYLENKASEFIFNKQPDKNKDQLKIINFLESYDKRYKDKNLISNNNLCFAQGGKKIGKTINGKEIGLQTIINLNTQLAFCHVYKGDSTFDTLFILRNIALPFISEAGHEMGTIFTKKSRVFTDHNLPYNNFIKQSGIDHHALSKRSAASITQFFIEIKNEFLPSCDVKNMNIGDIRKEVKAWVDEYNNKPILLFPNYGESPQSKWEKIIKTEEIPTI
jgi:ACT domain-containing protein